MALDNTLTGFIGKIRGTGLAVSSHYYVTFSGPGNNSEVTMLVDSVNMPGLNIMTNEYRTFGEVYESPYGITYNQITISVIVTNKAEALTYFHTWANQVYDRETRYSNYAANYLREINIVIQDKLHNDVYRMKIEDAYPKSIADISLDYSNHEVVKLSVTFAYRRWLMDERYQPTASEQEMVDNLQLRVSDIQSAESVYIDSRKQAFYEWGNPKSIPTGLQQYGGAVGASIGRACSNVQSALRNKTLIGQDGSNQSSPLSNSMGNLTSNFVKFGEGLKNLGRNINDVVAPVREISGAVSSVSETLGAVDNTLNALGMGRPFSKIRGNLNNTAGALYNVGLLKGVPGHLGTIGANMNGIGGAFKRVAESIEKSSNATEKISGSLNKLGSVFERQGSNTTNGANNLQSYSDSNP